MQIFGSWGSGVVSLNSTGGHSALGVGSIVLKKFRIDRTIAEGGMGLVVAATHLQLEQTVALKFFRGDLGGQGEPLMRFMREAKAAAQLRSEHVARVLDVGVTEEGTPFMVMEYLEGQSLESVVATRGPLDVATATEYAIQACEGLAEAHARGIVHRDIKPSNLFLVERSPGWGTIKILDFGISKVSLTQASNITTNLNMGTPCYMSPEQLRSTATVDHRTDIWSLGSTLYELLAGRAPFDPEVPLLSLAQEIVTNQPPALRDLRPEVPEKLAAIVSRCMAKDREERFGSAAAFAMALIPFTGQRARLSAERAVSITPALGVLARPENAGGRAGLGESDQPSPPAATTLTTELWRINSDVVLAGVPAAPANSADTVRVATEPIVPPVVPPEAPDAKLWNALRRWSHRWSQGQLITVASGLLLVCVVSVALLRGTQRPSPPSAEGVAAEEARPVPPLTPPPSLASRPPEPPSLNDLVVRVSPPWARVTIDGLPVQGNPFHGRYQPGDTHQIRAFAAGYMARSERVALVRDVVVELSLDRDQGPPQLRRNPATRPKAATYLPASDQSAAAPSPFKVPSSRSSAPGVAQYAVDPAGGRAPLRPIQTRSPYESP